MQSVKATKSRNKPNRKSRTTTDELNSRINLTKIKAAIGEKYGTTYKYCKRFKISEADMSRFLNKKCPISLKILMKHCKNLNLDLRVEVVSL